MSNLGEINRICAAHVSSLLLASTKSGYDEMANEGLQAKGLLVGVPMYDAFIEYSSKLSISDVSLQLLSGDFQKVPEIFYYMTCHREENTKDDNDLLENLKLLKIGCTYNLSGSSQK